MKKKWLSVVALSMCFCMGVGTFASCKGGDDESTGGTSNSEQTSVPKEEEEKPLTKDEIYAEVMKAVDATAKYNGAFSLFGEMKQSYVEDGETMAYTVTAKTTVDPVTKISYMQMINETAAGEMTQKSETTSKTFKEGDSYYAYSKQAADGEDGPIVEEDYKRVSQAYLDSSLEEVNLGDISSEVDMLSEIASIETFNAAFAEVFADSKAQIEAGAADEDSEWYQSTADGSCVISCEETDGAFVVTMKMNVQLLKNGEGGSFMTEVKLVAEDGYLTEITMKDGQTAIWYESSEDPDVTEPVKKEETSGSEMNYKLAYSFDQAAYDAIVTELPENVEDMEEEEGGSNYNKNVSVVLNGVNANSDAYFIGEDMQTAVESFLNSDWYYGVNVTWYMDAACTKAFTADVTEAEMEAMTTLYGQATLKDGYAFLVNSVKYAYAEDVTDAYKFVFSGMNMMDMTEGKTIEVVSGSFSVYERDGFVVTMNGEVITFTEDDWGCKDFTVEAGQTYTVEYSSTYAKADLNIFTMFM